MVLPRLRYATVFNPPFLFRPIRNMWLKTLKFRLQYNVLPSTEGGPFLLFPPFFFQVTYFVSRACCYFFPIRSHSETGTYLSLSSPSYTYVDRARGNSSGGWGQDPERCPATGHLAAFTQTRTLLLRTISHRSCQPSCLSLVPITRERLNRIYKPYSIVFVFPNRNGERHGDLSPAGDYITGFLFRKRALEIK